MLPLGLPGFHDLGKPQGQLQGVGRLPLTAPKAQGQIAEAPRSGIHIVRHLSRAWWQTCQTKPPQAEKQKTTGLKLIPAKWHGLEPSSTSPILALVV